jgi:hypothetical protein
MRIVDGSQQSRPMSANQSSQTFDLNGAPNYALQVSYAAPAAAAVFTAAPATDLMTKAAHGWYTGMKCQLTTTGTLPAGLALATDYWLIRVSADTFKLASSLAFADAGTAIDLTDAGTGSHTLTPTAGTLAHSCQLEKSVDNSNWYSEGSATAVSAAGKTLYENSDKAYRFLRVTNTVTTGQAVYSFTLNANG